MQAYDSKVVLITGGLGFIGSNLAMRLAKFSCAEIRIIDSLHPACGGNPYNLQGIERQIQVHTFDLCDAAKLRNVLCGVDVVFNLAGHVSHTESMNRPIQDLEGNIRAHLCLLESCRALNPRVRVVYSSTRQVYGRPQRQPVDEDHPVFPVDINGVNKYTAEQYHRIYHSVHGIETCTLRLTNTYGPRQLIRNTSQGVVGWFLNQVLRDDEIVLFGDGTQVRDLTYVDCVLDALLIAGLHPRAAGQVFNLGGEEPISLLELARVMIDIAGKGRFRFAAFPQERQKIDIGDYQGSYSRIHRVLGWSPKVSIRDGIRRTLEFYNQHRAAYIGV